MVTTTNPSNVTYDTVDMRENVQVWKGNDATYTNVPVQFLGGQLFRGTKYPKVGTQTTIAVDVPSEVYVLWHNEDLFATGDGDAIPWGRALPEQYWSPEGEGPRFCHPVDGCTPMQVYRQSVPAHGHVTLPKVSSPKDFHSVVVVPAGLFLLTANRRGHVAPKRGNYVRSKSCSLKL